MRGRQLFILLLFLLLAVLSATAQEESRYNTKPFKKRFGFDFMAYPAGQIYGLRAEFENRSGWELNLRLGYNRAFRKNFSGLNDDEQGGGFGISVGTRHYIYDLGFGGDHLTCTPFAGARVDLWRLNIFWKDFDNNPPSGTTHIGVLQPTFDVGLLFKVYNKWHVSVYGGFGQEINIVTQGKQVGQGGLWLGGITLCRNLWHWGKPNKK